MFKLLFTAKSKKQLKLISRQHHIQSLKAIFDDIKENPLIGKPLEDKLKHKYSYRVSVYRIIYKINWKNKTVTIHIADHREVVYEK